MKKIIIMLLSLTLLLSTFVVAASATEIPEERQLPRLVDDAGLLDKNERDNILVQLNEISERQKFDVVIVTVESYEQQDVKNAAYDFYDYNGYGYGNDNDGVMLFISMGEREFNLSATGYGITVFTDAGKEYIVEEIVPLMKDDEFYEAFEEFIVLTDEFIDQANTGEPYDKGNLPSNSFLIIILTLIVIVIAGGWIMATYRVNKEAEKLLSVSLKYQATDYIKEGSLNLTVSKRTHLYSTERVLPNPKINGGAGGSTIDFGSSGVGHSSISGKF